MEPIDDAVRRLDFLPWEYEPDSPEGVRQADRQRELRAGGATIGTGVFVAPNAAVYCDRLALGDRTYVAALAYLTGGLTFGADCSVNPFAVIRGAVTTGNGVRIGAHSSILGFNHRMSPDAPVFTQGVFSKGITLGDDVWIGSSATILDGVTVGSHVVIAAGAIVTKDVPDWGLVAGNPARLIRDRRADAATPARQPDLEQRLDDFGRSLAGQAHGILARCFENGRFVDRPAARTGGLTPAIRPWADAIELSKLLLDEVPPGFTADDLASRLTAFQDPATGLIPDADLSDAGLERGRTTPGDLSPFDGSESYHVLSVGYALRLLGRKLPHPITAAHALTGRRLTDLLDARNWGSEAWASGAAVDSIGTATAINMVDFADRFDDGGAGAVYMLFGWLAARSNPETGVWGTPGGDIPWLQPVNGFYRLTRGTFAQFGVPLPYPEQSTRTVLEHASNPALETGVGYTACNILDIIHPLWLAAKQTAVGRPEGRAWARTQLDRILDSWVDGEGFAFAPRSDSIDSVPGLQGTEMWLSVVWYLADYLEIGQALPFRPAGVHSPDPLVTFPPLLG